MIQIVPRITTVSKKPSRGAPIKFLNNWSSKSAGKINYKLRIPLLSVSNLDIYLSDET